MSVYSPSEIEPKWQKYWAEHETFKTDVRDFSKPKYYVLDMFPYPSGVGLHAGHPEGYTATDIMSRMKRMQGYNVLHPMGYDSFGLPAEQYANRADIAGGSTLGNIANTQVSLNTIDIGLAQLAMHSSFETAGAKDVETLVKALTAFYETALQMESDGSYALL